ncbi:MAG TPA: protein kinase [Candidatus Polarisedimenticolaceae bacterium]|nr:protein kinase [Candidatus Polarisedimenticolaceae bacterium]
MSGSGADPIAFLAAIPAFDGLPRELLGAMHERMEPRTFDKGDLLIRQDDTGEFLLVLTEGTADVSVRQSDGTRRTIGRVKAGDIVGEMALITGESRGADVEARERVRALALAATAFDRLARRTPLLGVVLTNLIADRLGDTSGDVLGGKTLNGYRIDRCVGRGGMAVVYEARRDADDRLVALKMMSHRLVYDSAALSRFRQEADVVERLEHENIARVFSRFSAFGTHFLVMEFLDGTTLDALRERGKPMPEALARPMVGQLSRALGYVHGRGMVHRDLKPGNVMITVDGRVKLMDFGLVKPLVITDERTATHEMKLVGTPSYMAPEQFSGEEFDHRVDIYALACLTLSMLLGEKVFRATNLLDLARRKLAYGVPPRREIGGGVSEEMHEFIVRGMDPRQERRLASLVAYEGWAGPVDLSALDD